MTLKVNKLLVFLSFLAFVFLTLFFISSPAFANNKNDDDKNKDKHKDKQNIVLNLSGNGTNIINSNKNENKNKNENEITITNNSQSVKIASIPRTLPATGTPLTSMLALLASIPIGLKLRRYK